MWKRKIQQIANKVALPFNLAALLIVLQSGWATYQNAGLSYTVWLPIVLIGTNLVLTVWAKTDNS